MFQKTVVQVPKAERTGSAGAQLDDQVKQTNPTAEDNNRASGYRPTTIVMPKSDGDPASAAGAWADNKRPDSDRGYSLVSDRPTAKDRETKNF